MSPAILYQKRHARRVNLANRQAIEAHRIAQRMLEMEHQMKLDAVAAQRAEYERQIQRYH